MMSYIPPHRRGTNNTTGNDSSLAELAERSSNYIPANEFQANYHLNVCIPWGAVDYKVHAPDCSCWRMKELQSNNSSPTNKQLNNLLVVAKPIVNIFFSEGTGVEAYKDDAQSCELKLANELFSGVPLADTDVKPKVSCAQCLLTADDKKNGFIGILSHSMEELQATVDKARKTESNEKDQGIVHSRNHADFVSAIKVSSLQSWLQEGSVQATNDVLSQITKGGVASLPYHNVQLEVTHPLETLLAYMSRSSSFGNLTYVMVWGCIDDGPRTVQSAT